MNEKLHMNRIIKKLYARELGLIEATPVVRIRRVNPIALIRQQLWSRHSAAVRVAMFALFMAMISAAIYYYNAFTINVYKVKMEAAQIDVQLQRRNDLIPNLIAVVKEYMGYEKNVFMHTADVRSAVKSIEETLRKPGTVAGAAALGAKELEMTSALSKFQAVAEAYPALKASDAYQALMKELSDTETRIAEMRINYNKAVTFYNSRLNMFPANLFNLAFSFSPIMAFESEQGAKSSPKMK
ncbi:magnetosome protein MamQ-1 [Candidatus Magnetobacterium bavaricum]|uniref:Magnetosome protein MamQ-1 n=1 Tax=Candidatus Magnetobacterium bavaricum TaxID=29290 RepID=A0A0F3GSP5_9BACT|nr:magnetosome protein MamQ-1 [Candidatus Magnetobacterium bavaricum]KJU84842.1 magnetosome protein MamQ-1 [Candidatus Magnetobacterium bavaricum]